MSTRQYIGARYVPKFVGTYDPTQAYDALDVVDNGSGTTYIARIQTPPNTPLTDATHWLVYGSSSGAILDLQGRVSTIEGEIPPIKASILSIGGQTDSNTAAIARNQADILSNYNQIKILKNKGRNIIMIGDSWAAGTLSASGKGWIDYLTPMLNADHVYPNCYGGSGFVATGTGVSNKSFIDLLNEISVPAGLTIDTVIVAGGVNDSGEASATLKSAIQAFCNRVDTLYPEAEIYIYIINQNINGSLSRFGYVTDYMSQNGYLKKVHVSDVRKAETINEWSERTHLTDEGYKQCARAIYCNMFGGIPDAGYANKTVTFTGHGATMTIQFVQNGKEISANVTNAVIVSNVTVSGGGEHNLEFTLDGTDNAFPANFDLWIPISLRLNINTQSTPPDTPVLPAFMNITNTKVTIRWIPYQSGTVTYPGIYIGPFFLNMGANW